MFAARRVFAGAAGNAVLGGTATATAVGAGTTAKLGAAGLGAAIWGATKGRTGHLSRVERSDHEVTANAQQPSWGSMPDA